MADEAKRRWTGSPSGRIIPGPSSLSGWQEQDDLVKIGTFIKIYWPDLACSKTIKTGDFYKSLVEPFPEPADVAGVVGTAPPTPVAEQVVVAPDPDYIWVEGLWLWFWGGWVWSPGYWHQPICGAGKATRLP
ncbi:MAG: YXWGXW repeat-containing protein [bacterium]|nr:YXWGXW repeat-containing protein [bacterium]